MEFKNKTVIITGGSNGIGEACAKAFYEAGANVAVLDVQEDNKAFNDLRWFYQACDVSKSGKVEAAVNAVYERFGSIDCLVNNAGIQRYGTVSETSEDDWDLVMNVNLKSYFLCSKYAIPLMDRSKGGVIINVSSVQAFVTQEKVAAYAASKTAILGLTRSIAIDYAPEIRCVAVCPGTIDTPMLRNAIALSPDPDVVMKECEDMHLVKRIGKPEEVAALIKFLCNDSASFITGEAIRVDGGLGIMIQGSKKG
jgi:NAD(P)-dependent dehydrogenase (short-subunit alcohol dehydrogenase family)